MALTQPAWTIATVNGVSVFTNTVTATTAENDIYTLKTPTQLDGTRPFTLTVNAAGTDISDNTDAVDIWGGYADDFVITGNDTTVAATNGFEIASAIMDDVSDEALSITVNPNRTAAKVQAVTDTQGEVGVPALPYYAFNIDSSGTVKAAETIFVITQGAKPQ